MGHGCCGYESDGRQFLTTEEKVKKLEDYKEWLDHESKGVSEAIAAMKKK